MSIFSSINTRQVANRSPDQVLLAVQEAADWLTVRGFLVGETSDSVGRLAYRCTNKSVTHFRGAEVEVSLTGLEDHTLINVTVRFPSERSLTGVFRFVQKKITLRYWLSSFVYRVNKMY